MLNRQVNRPNFKPLDKFRLVLLASLVNQWKNALLILQPDTLLKWHRQGFKLLWKIKSKPKKREPRIDQQTIELIRKMAAENPLWGAERIRGELLKLNISVSKRTIRKYMKLVRPVRPTNQNWKTFLKNHADQVWACDFLPIVDLFFGHLYAFFIVELSSRKVVHFGVTRQPTDEWTAQQLRETTGFGQGPKYLIRDNDRIFGQKFQRVAQDAAIEILKTPIKAPKANSIYERFLRSVRQEVLDHFFILNERHLY
jgi:putative transposase